MQRMTQQRTTILVPSVLALAVTTTLGMSLALAGCDLPPHQFFIVQDQVPGAGCVITTDTTAYRGQGVLDVRLVSSSADAGYVVFPLVKNDLPAPMAGETAQNRIEVKGFDVDIVPLGPQPANTDALLQSLDGGDLMHFRLPWSGVIEPGGGLRSAQVSVISAPLARRLRDTGDLRQKGSFLQLGARIRVSGDRSGSVDSDPFLFPIRVCDGCLIGRVESCPFAAAPTNAGNACNVAQDDVVDCCTTGDTLTCPPPVSP
ncbi:MAG: hypothetical protein QOI66_2597 [Myxococcales bacterium]|jgi:hypothetical protein|nr:hypothetical protein [Myxococcales bacterium]